MAKPLDPDTMSPEMADLFVRIAEGEPVRMMCPDRPFAQSLQRLIVGHAAGLRKANDPRYVAVNCAIIEENGTICVRTMCSPLYTIKSYIERRKADDEWAAGEET